MVSLYFSVITISTVGYGDFSPVTSIEMIFVIIFTLQGSIMMGYNLNAIGNLIDKLGEHDNLYNDKLKKNNRFNKVNKRNLQLREKAR